jgi:hypothetical protein
LGTSLNVADSKEEGELEEVAFQTGIAFRDKEGFGRE